MIYHSSLIVSPLGRGQSEARPRSTLTTYKLELLIKVNGFTGTEIPGFFSGGALRFAPFPTRDIQLEPALPNGETMRLDDDTSTVLPRGGTLAVRPVKPEDDEFLLGVYLSTREEELAQAQWAAGQKEMFVRWQFEMQRREYNQRFPDARYEVILVDGQPAGRIWVGSDDEQIRLLDIALLPQFQNRGAGTVLLRWLMDEAARANKVLRHMVFVLNNDAHRFYERLGFVMIEDLGAYKHMEWKQGQ